VGVKVRRTVAICPIRRTRSFSKNVPSFSTCSDPVVWVDIVVGGSQAGFGRVSHSQGSWRGLVRFHRINRYLLCGKRCRTHSQKNSPLDIRFDALCIYGRRGCTNGRMNQYKAAEIG